MNIRKFVVRAAQLTDLVALGSLTDRAAAFLDASVRAGLNIVVAGGTQAEANRHVACRADCGRSGWPLKTRSGVDPDHLGTAQAHTPSAGTCQVPS